MRVRDTSSNDAPTTNDTTNDNGAESSSVGPNSVVEQLNTDGRPIAFACEYQTGSDPLTTTNFDVVKVEQFYDLVYPCAGNKQDFATSIAQQLLNEAAILWKIVPDGEACTDPQSTVYGSWLFGVSSEGTDEFISDFGCQELTPDSSQMECCQVVRSEMTFIPTGGYNKAFLRQFIIDRLNFDEASFSPLLRTAAIDPVFEQETDVNDEARANLDDPTRPSSPSLKSMADGQPEQQSSRSVDREITVTGGFVIAIIAASLLCVFFLLYRHTRSKGKPRSCNATGKEDDFCDSTMDHGPSCEDMDFHHGGVTHPTEARHTFPCNFRAPSSFSMANNQNNPTSNLMLFDLPLDDDFDDNPNSDAKYTFDLSDTFRQGIMGAYAPTTMQVVAPYPLLEDTSCDSEVDSWAQTDGTVGSLEERLEEITAEI